MKLEIHEAANELPMMDAGRYRDLLESIKNNGQREPIILWQEKVLDGRNRLKACLELGIEPKFKKAEGNPFEIVKDLNGHRRDLSEDQRALIMLALRGKSEEWEETQRKLREAANAARSAATKAQPRNEDGTMGRQPVRDQIEPAPDRKSSHPERKAKAEMLGVSPSALARVEALKKARPDLARAVQMGEMKPAEARRTAKRDAIKEKIEELPNDKFRVIYADPPWQYNDSRGGVEGFDQTSAEEHYPTMKTSDICAMDVKSICQKDAVLFCWATFPLLEDALEVIKAWGFKYKTAFVWSKGRPNYGHYHQADAELLMVCTRGSCQPECKKMPRQVQEVRREGRHSEKPEAFRELIMHLYPSGSRIELFRRGAAPEGWKVWGNEAG